LQAISGFLLRRTTAAAEARIMQSMPRICCGLGDPCRITRALRVLETHHAPTYYLPLKDIHATLRPAQGSSFCEWKSAARYFDVLAGSATAPRAAWAYDNPTARFADLSGHVAFYAALMDEAWVGDLRVIPQPGNFYGGWVTPNLDGQMKGAPGTLHW
jgi:uncharacterized protein (DUF427 family)